MSHRIAHIQFYGTVTLHQKKIRVTITNNEPFVYAEVIPIRFIPSNGS